MSPLEKVIEGAFHVVLNMNDTFHWGCADQSEVAGEDLIGLLPLYEKYGYDAFVAYEAVKRGYDPDPEVAGDSRAQELFAEAKRAVIEALEAPESTIPSLSSSWAEWQEQIKKYGGRLVYSFSEPTSVPAKRGLFSGRTSNPKYYTCVCSVQSKNKNLAGLVGYAFCMADARKNLEDKMRSQGYLK